MAGRKEGLAIFGGLILFAIILVVVLMIVNDPDNPSSFKLLFSPINFNNIRLTSITENSVVVVGTTNREVHCAVEYGIDGQFTDTASDSDMMNMRHTEHLVTITDLEPSTKYDYRFKVTFEGDDYYSKIKSFVTSPEPGPQSELPEN